MFEKGKLANSIQSIDTQFHGILTNVDPSLVPDGFIPHGTNVTFDVSGKIVPIKAPQQLGSRVGLSPIKTIFVWKRDNGVNTVIAQSGNKLYYYNNGSWINFYTLASDDKASFAGGFFDKLFIVQKDTGFMHWDGNSSPVVWTGLTDNDLHAPKAKYLFMWTGYLFVGGDMQDWDKNESTGQWFTQPTPFRVRWSPPVDEEFGTTVQGLPKDFYWADTEAGIEYVNNFIDFRTQDNSTITGIGVWNRRIIIFTKDSIEELYGFQPEAFMTNTIYRGHLTAIDNSIAYYDVVYYLSPQGLCVMGREAIVIGDMYKKYWKPTGTYYSLTEHGGKIIGNQDNDVMVYDVAKKTFEHYVPFTNKIATYIYSSSDALYIGDNQGYVYTWDFTNGSSVLPWEFATREFTFGRIDRYKRPVALVIHHDKSNTSTTVNVVGYFDGTQKTIGTFDPSRGEYTIFWISEPLFKKAQFYFSGTGDVAIKAVILNAKLRRVGYV